jgi:hypothetical protein
MGRLRLASLILPLACLPGRIELGRGLALVLPQGKRSTEGFPTDRIPKAPTLALGDIDLAEEGVGLGLPVLKGRWDSVFPGSLRLRPLGPSKPGGPLGFAIDFEMNLVERLARVGGGSVEGRALHLVKELFALAHRELPWTRPALTALSEALRRVLCMETSFVTMASRGRVRVEYRVDPEAGSVGIRARTLGLALDGGERLVLMNEAGARSFDLYEDSDGLSLEGSRIETWQPVGAGLAIFRSRATGAFFSAARRAGATLYRGRELVAGRLSWAGLAYALPPGEDEFEYDLKTGVGP